MSTLASIQRSLLDQGEEIKALKLQGEEIKALKVQIQDHVGRSLSDGMVSAVQSSITNATTTWQEHLTASQNQLTTDIMSHLESLANVVRDLCRELGSEQQVTISDYSALVEQYNISTTNTNENSKAYGNELALMRLNLEACVDQLNWLITDLGLKAGPSTQPRRTPPELMDMVMDSAYENYFRGDDMAHAKTSPSGISIPDNADNTTKTCETVGTDGNTEDVTLTSEPLPPDQVDPVEFRKEDQGVAIAPQPTGRPGTPPCATAHGPLQAPPTNILLPPSPGDRKRPPPDRHTDMAVETSQGHDITTGTPKSTTERTTDISSDTQLLPVRCTTCTKETSTDYQCDLCGRVLCMSCTTVTLDAGLVTCQNCTRPGASDTTSRSKESHSLTPSDSSEGSSFSQRSSKPNPRRRQVRAKLDPSTSASRTAGKTDDTPLTTITPKTKATRRTVQTAIDTLLPPRGKEPTKGLTKMETRKTRTSTRDA